RISESILTNAKFEEAASILHKLQEQTDLSKVQYKALRTGELNGRRTKDRILKQLSQLHADFAALSGGDDREFFSRLATIAEKRVSIHV
ncbi:MAG: hypothetical protein LRY51_16280, partial [Geovibrio sp.]|nr:hypothetical protein [Geovibrio sp.]